MNSHNQILNLQLSQMSIKILLSPGNANLMKAIEDAYDVYIEKSVHKQYINIYGPPLEVKEAIIKINR